VSPASERGGEPRAIEILPEALADQIAAGEVVERPASVIKELCENAVDAGASRVDVEITSGGVLAAIVSDDGSGMGARDLALCVQRHATSKIRAIDDLMRIGTFGFRGEALASIASVSRTRITSRRRDEAAGHTILVEGGVPGAIAPSGAPPGTRVEVRELFYNVPARRKFLKALATESAHVSEAVEAVALASPSISVTLTRDGRKVRELLRAPSREARVVDLLGDEELSHARGERGPLRVEAWLSKPSRARSGAGSLRILVNDRLVKDRALARAVAQAYGGALDPGRYPIGVVYVDLPPELVDVNVHPQKSEVRFAEARAAQDALYRIVEASLREGAQAAPSAERRAPYVGRSELGARTRPGPNEASELATPRPPAVWSGSGELAAPRSALADAGPASAELDARARALAEKLRAPLSPVAQSYPVQEPLARVELPRDAARSFGALRFVAELRSCYLVAESEEALVLLDRHAASERALYEALSLAHRAGPVPMRASILPELVELGPEAVARIDARHAWLLELGLDLRPAGAAQIAVHALPELVAHRASPRAIVVELARILGSLGETQLEAEASRVHAELACAGAIAEGERLPADEARTIVEALSGLELRRAGPLHKRLVLEWTSFRELEHRAGRR